MNQNALVRVLRTSDPQIDQFAGLVGHITETREINDRGYQYTQVRVVFDDGKAVWVNDNEVEVV